MTFEDFNKEHYACFKVLKITCNSGELPETSSQTQTSPGLLETWSQHSYVQDLAQKLTPQLPCHQLINAFYHTSFVHEFRKIFGPEALKSNENLEFLGDAILDAVVSHELYKRFPNTNEGKLSKLRGTLVNKEALAELGRYLNLGHCLLLGRGEMKTGGPQRESLLANTFEALIGQYYLYFGFEKTYSMFIKLIEEVEEQRQVPFFDLTRLEQFDAKTQLQEWTMQEFKVLPDYYSIEQGTEDFVVTLKINGVNIASKTKSSKKKAIKELAQEAMNNKHNIIEKIKQENSSC